MIDRRNKQFVLFSQEHFGNRVQCLRLKKTLSCLVVKSTPSSAKYITQRAEGKSFQLVRANKKLLQKQILSELGKVVSLKDLSNIHQKQKLNSGINSLEGSVKLLKCTYGGVHGNDDSWL